MTPEDEVNEFVISSTDFFFHGIHSDLISSHATENRFNIKPDMN